MQLVIAEKPSVARDLARVLGVRPSGRTAFSGPGRTISWCVGHLVELDEPAAYEARWKAWRLDTLPMLPERFKLRPVASTRDQFRAVTELLGDRRFSEVVNACDAGREGELIFRYVYELAGSRLPIRRLWISSLTDEAIRQGFERLRAGADYDALAAAARCRSEADWLVGLNATRAVTVRHRTGPGSPLYSIGRVQTPTLALVAARDRAIDAFIPRDYWEVTGRFTVPPGVVEARWTHDDGRTRFGDRPTVDALLARLETHARAADPHGPRVDAVKEKVVKEPPPLLFDLTSLQRTANRRFGFSAARTLEIAQALYETHKVLTYPRTDSRFLSQDVAALLPRLFRNLGQLPPYRPFVEQLMGGPDPTGDADGSGVVRWRSNRRVFDDKKVEDHHAIIPTGKVGGLAGLDRDQQRIFDLVVRRFLGAFFPDAEFAATEIIVLVGPGSPRVPAARSDRNGDGRQVGSARQKRVDPAAGPDGEEEQPLLTELGPPPDRFVARGRVRVAAGWQEVAGFGEGEGGESRKGPSKTAGQQSGSTPAGQAEPTADPSSAPLMPRVGQGQRLDGAFTLAAKQTRPPPRLNDATLLAAMETAGRAIEDEELRAAMKETGLGTPATRAATIETLLKRGFLQRAGKNLVVTPSGHALLRALPVPSLASPELTGAWEARLSRIARGLEDRKGFMHDISAFVKDVVAAIRGAPPTAPPPAARVPDQSRASASENPRSKSAARTTGKSPGTPRSPSAEAGLRCPRCRQGEVLAGNRGWGCSRWREGCAFVIWFETAGKRLTGSELRALVEKGKTRKTQFSGGGGPVVGRLVLDLDAARDAGAARFEPA